jgi:putative endonuclease
LAHLYILRSITTGKFYVGATVDLARRLGEHGRGHSPFTRGRGPWELVYEEEYPDLAGARRREREIKSWKSHARIAELARRGGLR